MTYRSLITTSRALVLLSLLAVACAETNTNGGGGTGGSSSGSGGSAGTAGSSGAANGGAANGGSAGQGGSGGGIDLAACKLKAPAGAATIVVNEISAKSNDWVELKNIGSTPVDLGGMTLADYDNTTNCPKPSSALVFPSGTSVPAGGYLLILAGQTGADNTPQTDCLDAGVASCFHVSFGISAGGDGIFLIDPQSTLIAQELLPADVISDSTQTWARLPDGTGNFALGRPTPGAANVAF